LLSAERIGGEILHRGKRGGHEMAAIRLVVNFRVKPGRYADLFEAAKPFKKMVERFGGNFVVGRVTTGDETGNIVAVHTYQSWTAFDKANSDLETQKLLEATYNNPNPPYESFTVTVVEEVAL
jgi:hypothetical protein